MSAVDHVAVLPAAHAVDVDDVLDRLALVLEGAVARIDEPLEVRQGDDAVEAVAELVLGDGIGVEAGGHDDGARVDGAPSPRSRARSPWMSTW